MDGLKMMEWSERMWGYTDQTNRTRIQDVVAEMGGEETVRLALGGLELSHLILGLALIGMEHARVPMSPMHEPSLC
jgi:hypothetical protein